MCACARVSVVLGFHGPRGLRVYSPPQLDRRGLWRYYNKIVTYPIIFYLLKGDYRIYCSIGWGFKLRVRTSSPSVRRLLRGFYLIAGKDPLCRLLWNYVSCFLLKKYTLRNC